MNEERKSISEEGEDDNGFDYEIEDLEKVASLIRMKSPDKRIRAKSDNRLIRIDMVEDRGKIVPISSENYH